MARREILIIVALLILIALLIKAIEFFRVEVVEADAEAFVMEELQTKYPGSDTEIMSISTKYNEWGGKYFEVKTKVTHYPQSPCPERSHIYYNYPVQNFVSQLPDVITSDCEVCTEGICTIAFPEEAIIASHTFEGTEAVASYINGNSGVAPYVVEKEESWSVTWDSGADHYYVVDLHRNGSILSVKRVEKS